ncbi:MAG: VacJ family lipoprotein [Gammaproteobacteria bacterium]|nr:VacJ family lipoprotein [Gammaproteobacteria bacterium]
MVYRRNLNRHITVHVLMVLCALALAGCASTKGGRHKSTASAEAEVQSSESESNERDPFEKVNRAMFKFNVKVDKYVAKPIAKGYRRAIPKPVRKGISNFFSNLREPIVILNDLLQGKFKQAGSDLGRFLMNSTVGFYGLLDVAGKAGLQKHDEDFGQTLGKWGVKDGPYLVLPFFGPGGVRDSFGLVVDNQVDSVSQKDDSSTRSKLVATRFVDTRTNLLDATDILEQAGAADPYLFVREFYRQRRQNLIYDGNPPEEDELDPFLLEDEGPSATSPAPTPLTTPSQTVSTERIAFPNRPDP